MHIEKKEILIKTNASNKIGNGDKRDLSTTPVLKKNDIDNPKTNEKKQQDDTKNNTEKKLNKSDQSKLEKKPDTARPHMRTKSSIIEKPHFNQETTKVHTRRLSVDRIDEKKEEEEEVKVANEKKTVHNKKGPVITDNKSANKDIKKSFKRSITTAPQVNTKMITLKGGKAHKPEEKSKKFLFRSYRAK